MGIGGRVAHGFREGRDAWGAGLSGRMRIGSGGCIDAGKQPRCVRAETAAVPVRSTRKAKRSLCSNR